jgi:peptidoglycan hydrolase CwlO-like protein
MRLKEQLMLNSIWGWLNPFSAIEKRLKNLEVNIMTLKEEIVALTSDVTDLKKEKNEILEVVAAQAVKTAELAAKIEELTASLPSEDDLVALRAIGADIRTVSSELDAVQPKPEPVE